MTDQECEAINTERLAVWAARNVREHATPIILLGVGHDRNSGQFVVNTLGGMSDADLLAFLETAAVMVRDRIARTAQQRGGGRN